MLHICSVYQKSEGKIQTFSGIFSRATPRREPEPGSFNIYNPSNIFAVFLWPLLYSPYTYSQELNRLGVFIYIFSIF